MKSPIVYFDTSFFCGLLDNVSGREAEAQKIVNYERKEGSEIYTSIMTINEFIIKTYDKHHAASDVDDKVKESVTSIRRIAKIYAFNEDVAKEAARLQSAWGRHRSVIGEGRDRKFRWDAIHLASANLLHATRVYAWDGVWPDVPLSLIPNVTKLISPALVPMEPLFPENTKATAEGGSVENGS